MVGITRPMATLLEFAVQQSLSARFGQARRETDSLFQILHPSIFYARPIPERHRIVFYIGHLEAFDWNLLRDHLGLPTFNPTYDHLFAFGIDPVDGGLPTDTPTDWPTIAQVDEYRQTARQQLDAALAAAPETSELTTLLNIAIEHRYMHAETLEYMFHQLPLNVKNLLSPEPVFSASPATPEMIWIPDGEATLGLKRESGQFGWDNEFEEQVISVPSFEIDKYKVTNGEFLHFVNAGGYQDPHLWSQSDWEWRAKHEVSHPVFWVPTNDGWNLRTMFDEVPLPLNRPVYVSHAEASAYARWVGKALPTEAQWHRAAYGTSQGKERQYPWGNEPPTESRIHWTPPPVGVSPETQSAFGLNDLLATGWEWTATEFGPLPGFQIMPSYPGYSANFFDGKHYVIKGGSTRTDVSMLRRSFRNWFQPHYQYVYAGFRCVKDSQE